MSDRRSGSVVEHSPTKIQGSLTIDTGDHKSAKKGTSPRMYRKFTGKTHSNNDQDIKALIRKYPVNRQVDCEIFDHDKKDIKEIISQINH